MVNKKVLHALEEQLVPIVCVGENSSQRESGEAESTVEQQLVVALRDVRLHSSSPLFIAYEPVWAIGTGDVASVADVVNMHQHIRGVLGQMMSPVDVRRIAVLYGGSVDGENAYGFLREADVDGVLVGSSSVKLSQLSEIVHAAAEVLEAQHPA